jgi:hypothetical protein
LLLLLLIGTNGNGNCPWACATCANRYVLHGRRFCARMQSVMNAGRHTLDLSLNDLIVELDKLFVMM